MTKHSYIMVTVVGLCLGFLSTRASKDCDSTLCPGPLYYYEEIGCTPIFENSTSCCPTRYNCDAWENLPKDKCLINGHVYQKGEQLNLGESRDPCSFYQCGGFNHFGYMKFPCGLHGLSPESAKPRNNCRMQESKLNCSQEDEICDDDPVGCIIDGRPYKINEEFTPSAEPNKLCYCTEGYTGVNDERFCIWKKPSWCENMLESPSSIRAHCVPVYAHNASLQVDCNDFLQCPNADENYVIQGPEDNDVSTSVSSASENADKRCRFGELTMGIGEEFTSSNWRGPFRCACEVPPVPTCRLSSAVTDESI